jgi:hypothetical protein
MHGPLITMIWFVAYDDMFQASRHMLAVGGPWQRHFLHQSVELYFSCIGTGFGEAL